MKPKKRFGQNFLQDESVLHRIVGFISPQKKDCVVEIGPGQGALTKIIAPLVSRLDLVEIDRDLVSFLKQQNLPETVNLYSADALRFDFSSLQDSDNKKIRVIGNLPYNISTPLLFHLFSMNQLFQDMHFMLQQEVVMRICAQPGDSNYGRLSIMAQYYCDPQLLFLVPPESFNPQPKVMSALVRLVPRTKPQYEVLDWRLFSNLVKQAFTHRRKTIRNALGSYFSEEVILSLSNKGFDFKLRPQQLSGKEYALIANCILSVAKG